MGRRGPVRNQAAGRVESETAGLTRGGATGRVRSRIREWGEGQQGQERGSQTNRGTTVHRERSQSPGRSADTAVRRALSQGQGQGHGHGTGTNVRRTPDRGQDADATDRQVLSRGRGQGAGAKARRTLDRGRDTGTTVRRTRRRGRGAGTSAVAVGASAALLAGCLAGCSGSNAAAATTFVMAAHATSIPVSVAQRQLATQGANGFAVSLLRALGAGDGDLTFSPQTLSDLLALVAPGLGLIPRRNCCLPWARAGFRPTS